MENQSCKWATSKELTTIRKEILHDGYTLLWSDIFQDIVGFYLNAEDKAKIHPDFIPYSLGELCALFRVDQLPNTLRLIHEIKKLGAKIVESHSGICSCGSTLWWQKENGQYICQWCHPRPKKSKS